MRKTEEYFLHTVPSSDDLAAPVAELLRQHHPTLRPRTIIIAPSQEYAIVRQNRLFTIKFGQRTTPERILVFGEDQLVVIEKRPDSTLDEIIIRFGKLVHVELGVILLYGYVRFTWIAASTLKTLKIEYNGVGDLMMRAEVERLRLTMCCPEGSAAVPPHTDWASILTTLPLKFGNYLQYALFAGEPVLQVVFQPTIGASRRFRVSEDRTLALTPEGLIVLEEAKVFLNYGMVIRYLPFRAIQRIRFEPESDRVWLRLSLGVSEIIEETAIPLSRSNAQCLRDALRRFASSIPVVWADEDAPSLAGVTG